MVDLVDTDTYFVIDNIGDGIVLVGVILHWRSQNHCQFFYMSVICLIAVERIIYSTTTSINLTTPQTTPPSSPQKHIPLIPQQTITQPLPPKSTPNTINKKDIGKYP